jgi:hypothetical protein
MNTLYEQEVFVAASRKGKVSELPIWTTELGETLLQLPLGGIACSDPTKVRKPLVRPLWLLMAAMLVLAASLVWIRLCFA